MRDRLRVGFRIKGNEVVLFEERPDFHPRNLLDEVAEDPAGIFWG